VVEYDQVIDVTLLVVYTFSTNDVVPCVQKITELAVLVAALTGAAAIVTVDEALPLQPPALVPTTLYVVVAVGLAYTVDSDVPV
jgi:phosphohistidine swiveling domain-containing protein